MAGEPQGLMHFPGINQIVGGSFTLAHGIVPSVAQLSIAPQPGWPAEGGTLSITFGSVSIEFPDCKVDSANFSRGTGGQIVSVQIFDRRWKWKWGAISGRYNMRNADGSIRTDTEKTPQELAELLLDAMGEEGYDVGQLPNDARPEVNWDFDVPAEALAQICDDLTVRIVLGLDNRVRLMRSGQGATLPTSYFVAMEATANPPEKPDRIAVVSAPVRFQLDLELEAVGLDSVFIQGQRQDGANAKYETLDRLSYKPAGGWQLGDFPNWISVDENSRIFAQESILKSFRVKVPFSLPEVDERTPTWITSLDQFILLNERVELISDENGNSVIQWGPALVRGEYFANQLTNLNNIPNLTSEWQNNEVIDRDFTINTQEKIVQFHDCIYANQVAHMKDESDTPPPNRVVPVVPTLRLRATIVVLTNNFRGQVRYVRERATGSNFGTPTRYILRDDLQVCVIAKYTPAFGIAGSIDNLEAANIEADHYLDAAEAEYEFDNPQSVIYPGIVRIEPDGAICQITWSVGLGGCTTQANRNNEQRLKSIPYREMRRIQRQQSEIKRLAKIASDPLLNGQRDVRRPPIIGGFGRFFS